MKHFHAAARAIPVLMLSGLLAHCSLPPLEPWEDETGPRVVFEPPRTVTLPPWVMAGESVEPDFPLMSTEPPAGAVTPSLLGGVLPEVAPMVVENEFENVVIPDFPPAPKNEADDAPENTALPGAAPGLKLKAPVSSEAFHDVLQRLREGMQPRQGGAGDQKETAAVSAQSPPTTQAADLPNGVAVPGRPGMVKSPRAAEHQLVDVTGLTPGETVKCPFTGDLFRVPAVQEAANKADAPEPDAGSSEGKPEK